LRRRIARVEPNAINTERSYVFKMIKQTNEVTSTVAIAIGE
jgi:hypothetical protein